MRPPPDQRREVRGKRRRGPGGIDENEIVPALAPHRLEPHPVTVDAGALVIVRTAEARRHRQRAIERVCPGVIAADQLWPALLLLSDELHAAVPTDIVKSP